MRLNKPRLGLVGPGLNVPGLARPESVCISSASFFCLLDTRLDPKYLEEPIPKQKKPVLGLKNWLRTGVNFMGLKLRERLRGKLLLVEFL